MSFPDKFLKKLPEGFADNMAAADTEELKSKILESERHIYEIDHERENNEELTRARENLKNISQPFRDAKATETAKIKYCLHVLQDRGVVVG